jgi:hypothetical protein
MRGLLAASWLILVAVPVLAVPPPEVTTQNWCPGRKDCFTWSSTGQVQYRIYRGDGSALPLLLNGSTDSCLVRIFTGTTTTGPGVLTALPAPGAIHWYLITAKNCDGEGPAGNATSGPRILNSSGGCTPPTCTDGVQDGNETGVDCGGGCAGCPDGALCCMSIDCATSQCNGGICGVRPNGAACSAPRECQSGFCADGVCCSEACTSPCRSCNYTTPGTCVNIGLGDSPTHGMCPSCQLCTGSGSCCSMPQCTPPNGICVQ